jgi:predicted HD superfamily hydrolase involved in NAD metabolism
LRPAQLSFSELARAVRAYLNQDHRYRHSVRVARCADLLAQHHGLDTGRARIAGLLHDVARLHSPAELIEQCAARGLAVDDFERMHPVVLHARVGAAIARERFGVRDPAVLSAIEKHTVATTGMSALDRAVYLADSLEPERSFPERPELWRLALLDLDEAMRATIAQSLAYLSQRGLKPAPQTLAAARELGLDARETCASAN